MEEKESSHLKDMEEAKYSPNSKSDSHLMEQLSKRSDLHLARKIFHMVTGLIIILVYAFLVNRTAAALLLSGLLILSLGVEYLRMNNPQFNKQIMSNLGVIMRKSEADGVSGVAFYLAAALIAVAIFPKSIALLAIAYLAFGDPIASTFGILYGDRGPRFSNGKSLIGTLAGVLTCFLLTFVFLSHLHIGWDKLLLIAALGGFAGGAVENLPLDIDDNFSIPVVAGFVLWILFVVFNV